VTMAYGSAVVIADPSPNSLRLRAEI